MRPHSMWISTASAAAIMLMPCGIVGSSAAFAQEQLVQPSPSAGTIRREISTGRLTSPVGGPISFTPCEPTVTPSFRDVRTTARGLWAASLELVKPGKGTWTLRIADGTGAQVWEKAAGSGGREGDIWATPVFIGTRVDITLVGPGAGSACPEIVMRTELKHDQPSVARGLVGPDDRLSASDSEFIGQTDAARLADFAKPIVRLRILDDNGQLLQCTGFFVSANVLMTAAHCVTSHTEAAHTVVHLPDRDVTGDNVILMAAQGGLDFTLLFVKGANRPDRLTLGLSTEPALVLWQFPTERAGAVVSLKECAVAGAKVPFVGHRCDSSVGASGAPLQIRSDGVVLAIHTSGCKELNGTTNCVNRGTLSRDIRARIGLLEQLLLAANPAAANELFAALKQP